MNAAEHIHMWRDPEPDFTSRFSILFTITGQVCDCGAKQLYQGPMYGWTLLESTERITEMKNEIDQLSFPSVIDEDEGRFRACLICGATPMKDTHEYRMPDGMISMSVDADLCLECAVHFWRAFKHSYQSTARREAIRVLSRYGPTASSARKWLSVNVLATH